MELKYAFGEYTLNETILWEKRRVWSKYDDDPMIPDIEANHFLYFRNATYPDHKLPEAINSSWVVINIST